MSMKKKVLCVFFLMLYLLTACTLLSRKIEAEMATQVQITERRPISANQSSMTLDALFYEDGVGWLYEVTEGTGWSDGLRSTLVPEERWSYEEFGKFIRFVGGKIYWFVETASRNPVHGGRVEIIDTFETGADRYLFHCPEGIPETLELPETWTVAAQSGSTMLLDVPDGIFPFFQHRTKLLMAIPRSESSRIISLTEAERFLEALPSVVMVFLALLAGLVFWGFACLLSIRIEKNRPFIWINAALVIASLAVMVFILEGIDLPASLLPAGNIFDWKYYEETFALIFGASEAFAVTDLLSVKDHFLAQCFTGFKQGILVILLTILAETGILWIIKWNKKRKRYIGKYLKK